MNLKRVLLISVVFNIMLLAMVLALGYKFNIVQLAVNKIFPNDNYAYNVLELNYYQEMSARYNMHPNNEGEIIFLGDSLTEYSYFEEIFIDELVINRGIGSDTTEGVYYRLPEVVESNPEKIFLMVGINDIGNGMATDEIINNYQEILEYIQTESPKTKVYIQSVLPCNTDLMEDNLRNNNRTFENIYNLNEQLKMLGESMNCEYIELDSSFRESSSTQMQMKYTVDGVHLSEEGYALWADVISQYVYE
ncbi:MAG: GDSL-type esterase/lipase family protein [Lachnospiraceae bacterium]